MPAESGRVQRRPSDSHSTSRWMSSAHRHWTPSLWILRLAPSRVVRDPTQVPATQLNYWNPSRELCCPVMTFAVYVKTYNSLFLPPDALRYGRAAIAVATWLSVCLSRWCRPAIVPKQLSRSSYTRCSPAVFCFLIPNNPIARGDPHHWGRQMVGL